MLCPRAPHTTATGKVPTLKVIMHVNLRIHLDALTHREPSELSFQEFDVEVAGKLWFFLYMELIASRILCLSPQFHILLSSPS